MTATPELDALCIAQEPRRYSEFLGRVIEEFNMDTSDQFTRLLATAFALQDDRDAKGLQIEFMKDTLESAHNAIAELARQNAANDMIAKERDAAFALLRVCQDSVHPDTRVVIRALIQA